MVTPTQLRQQRDLALKNFREKAKQASILEKQGKRTEARRIYDKAKGKFVDSQRAYKQSIGRTTGTDKRKERKKAQVRTITGELTGFAGQTQTETIRKNGKVTSRIVRKPKGKPKKAPTRVTKVKTTTVDKRLGPKQILSSKQKKVAEQVIKDLGLKPKLYSDFRRTLTKGERDLLNNASNRAQASQVIRQIQEREAKAEKQKLDNFLRQTTIKPKNRADVKLINNAIDREIKKLETNATTANRFKNARKNVLTELNSFIGSAGKTGLKVISPTFAPKVMIELGKIVYNVAKGGAKGLKATFNYGRNLVNRGFWSRKNNPLVNDIKKLSVGTFKVTSYVANNPAESSMIVGIAVASGASITLKTLRTKPEKAVAEAVFFLAPVGAVTKPFKFAGRTIKNANEIKRVVLLNNKVLAVKKTGKLSNSQINSLNNAIIRASKLSKSKERTETLKRALKRILKQRGVKPKRNASLNTLIGQVKESAKVKVKVKVKSKKKAEPKKTYLSVNKKGEVSKRTVTAKTYNKLFPEPKVKGTRDTTRYAKVVNGKPVKITKAEFLKLQKKQPQGKVIDIKDVETAQVQVVTPREIKSRVIDFNKATSKDVSLTSIKGGRFKGKKGQVQININKSVNVVKSTVKKIKKTKKRLTKKQKVTINRKISKLDKLIRLLVRLNIITKAKGNSYIKVLSQARKDINKIKTTPKQEIAPKLDTGTIVSLKPATTQKVASKVKPKTSQRLKGISRPKAKVKPKPPVRPKRIRLIKLRLANLKRKGTRQGYIIQIKEGNRIVARSQIPLPRKRATNIMRARVDNTPQASGEIVKKGKTSIVDVKKTSLGFKFRPKRSKNPKVRREVEKKKYRIDKKGEKKGLKKAKSKTKSKR